MQMHAGHQQPLACDHVEDAVPALGRQGFLDVVFVGNGGEGHLDFRDMHRVTPDDECLAGGVTAGSRYGRAYGRARAAA